MNWEEYCNKHLYLVKRVLNNIKLSLRKNPEEKHYLLIIDLIKSVRRLLQYNSYCGMIPIDDMLGLYGKTLIWIEVYKYSISEKEIRNEANLLKFQLKKQLKKNYQRKHALIEHYGFDPTNFTYDYD